MFGVGGLLGLGGLGLYADDEPVDSGIVSPLVSPGQHIRWRVAASIGGVDRSAQLLGRISIRRVPDGAATATVSLLLPVGAVDPYDYIAATVELSYQEVTAAGALIGSVLMYSGLVESPEYDDFSRILTLICTDDYQGVIKALGKSEVDALVPGYDPGTLYDMPESMLEYARQRLRSAQGDIFLNISRAPAYAPWIVGAIDHAHADGFVVNRSTRIARMAERSSMTNEITITFKHRFILGWHRLWKLAWDIGWLDDEWLVHHYSSYPSKEMIRSAIKYPFKETVWRDLPPSGVYTVGLDDFIWTNKDKDKKGALGFQISAMQRWTQDYVINYQIAVRCPASITRFGTNPEKQSFSIDTDASITKWGSEENYIEPGVSGNLFTQTLVGVIPGGFYLTAYTIDPEEAYSISIAGIGELTEGVDYLLHPFGIEILEGGVITEAADVDIEADSMEGALKVFEDAERVDYVKQILSPDSELPVLDNGVRCVIAEAYRKIKDGHRQTQIVWETLLNPTAQLGQTSRRVGRITATGNISGVEHAFDFDRGSAKTRHVISLSQPNVAGQTQSAIVSPSHPFQGITPASVTLPALATHLGYANDPPLTDDETWTGYIGNIADVNSPSSFPPIFIDNHVFQERFSVEFPEVPDADRNEAEATTTRTYNVAIPQDELVIT